MNRECLCLVGAHEVGETEITSEAQHCSLGSGTKPSLNTSDPSLQSPMKCQTETVSYAGKYGDSELSDLPTKSPYDFLQRQNAVPLSPVSLLVCKTTQAVTPPSMPARGYSRADMVFWITDSLWGNEPHATVFH
jgi:hypothetical protein